MALRIPEEYQDGFIVIRKLEEEQVQELISALEEQEPTLNRLDLRLRIGERITTIPLNELDKVMETLLSLYALRDDMGLSIPDFAEVISDTIEESDNEGLRFADDMERGRFDTNLVKLLGAESLDIAARATDLQYEHERTIHGIARVLTDMRPVFGINPEDPPRGAVIAHTLKISYHEGRDIKEFFVALDTDQLDELIGVLVRAGLKAESLKRFLGKTEVPYIDAE